MSCHTGLYRAWCIAQLLLEYLAHFRGSESRKWRGSLSSGLITLHVKKTQATTTTKYIYLHPINFKLLYLFVILHFKTATSDGVTVDPWRMVPIYRRYIYHCRIIHTLKLEHNKQWMLSHSWTISSTHALFSQACSKETVPTNPLVSVNFLHHLLIFLYFCNICSPWTLYPSLNWLLGTFQFSFYSTLCCELWCVFAWSHTGGQMDEEVCICTCLSNFKCIGLFASVMV